MADTENFKPGEKPKGWHSRRHATNEAHTRANEHYEATHASGDRIGSAPGEIEQMAVDQVIAQIKKLDGRLGSGVGARKERARLTARLVQVA